MAASFLSLCTLLGCLYTRLFQAGGLDLRGPPAPRGGSTRLAVVLIECELGCLLRWQPLHAESPL